MMTANVLRDQEPSRSLVIRKAKPAYWPSVLCARALIGGNHSLFVNTLGSMLFGCL